MKKENNPIWKPILFGFVGGVCLVLAKLDVTMWQWWVCMVSLAITHEITK